MTSQYGSLEVFYTYPSDSAKTIELVTNIQGVKQFNVGIGTPQNITVAVGTYIDEGAVYAQVQTYIGGLLIDRSDFPTYQGNDVDFAVRIFFFDQFLSVNVNGVWVYSYAFASISYDDDITCSVKMDGSTTTITGLRRVELSDGREAVFVDYESTTDNAIQSIIQQRPIQILPHVNRKLTFTYNAEKDTINVVKPSRIQESHTHPTSMSSDGLVYAEDTSVAIDLETARQVGLITRLYRLSELSTGANKAARTTQKRAREQSSKTTVIQRLDPRLELTDILHIDKTISSTNRHILKDVIIEDIRISLRDGAQSMTIVGRDKSGS